MTRTKTLVVAWVIALASTALAQEAPVEEPTPATRETVVTATRMEEEYLDVPADVRVVREERLARPGTKSAPAALSEVSGIKLNPRQDNAVFSDVEVRGLAGNATSGGNVLVLLDGIPQRRLSFGGPYLGALPFRAVTRMELVKGPLSALYGRNALAGALQLFTDAGGEEVAWDLGASWEWPANEAWGFARAGGPVGESLLGASRPSTASMTASLDYASGWQPRAGALKGDAYLHADLRLGDLDTVTVLWGFHGSREDYVAPVPVDAAGNRLPGIDRDANLAVPGQNDLELQEHRVAVRHTRDWLPQVRTKLTAAYWRGDTTWATGRPDDRPATGTVMARPASDRSFAENALFLEAELQARYSATDWLDGALSFGGSYEHLTYALGAADITTAASLAKTGKYAQGIPLDLATLEEPGRDTWVRAPWSRRDTTEHDGGVFLRKQFALWDRVFVHGGLRWDAFVRAQVNPVTGEEASRTDWALSPGVGLDVAAVRDDHHRFNVYGNWGRGFSPVFRAVNNTHFADVRPETSEGFDAGVKGAFWDDVLEVSAAYYQLWRRDIVAMNPATRLQENTGDWRIRGVEADVAVHPIRELRVRLAYAWRDPRIERFDADPALAGNRIPAISDHALTADVEFQVDMGIFGGTDVRWVSSRQGNEQNAFELPGYVLWDAWVGYDWKKTVRVAVFAKNLLDQEHLTAVFNGVKNGSAFEGPPRTLGASLTVHL